MYYNKIASVFLVLVFVVWTKDLTTEEGHLKPFGHGRPNLPAYQLDLFPQPNVFFENFVFPGRPTLMKEAARDIAAFTLWTDDYLRKVSAEHDITVKVEMKEGMTEGLKYMAKLQLTEFLSGYMSKGYYLTTAVPQFLSQDVGIPCSIQCPLIVNGLLDNALMWMNGGGSSTPAHKDGIENILCVLRGDKLVTLVDPIKHGRNLHMNVGMSSDINTDSVDFTVYPGMAEVEFLHANLTAGDCVYIPYQWIHQIRSYGSNLAVSFWWRHIQNPKLLDLTTRNTKCDQELTLNKVVFQDVDDSLNEAEEFRKEFLQYLGTHNTVSKEQFEKLLIGESTVQYKDKLTKDWAGEVVKILDNDNDGFISKEEILSSTSEVYMKILKICRKLEADIQTLKYHLQQTLPSNTDANIHIEL